MALKLEQEEKETVFLFMNALLPHFGSRLMLEVAVSIFVLVQRRVWVQVWIRNYACFLPLHAFLVLHRIFFPNYFILIFTNRHTSNILSKKKKNSIQYFVVSVQDNFRVTCAAYGINDIIDRMTFQVVIWMWARNLNVDFCLVIILCFSICEQIHAYSSASVRSSCSAVLWLILD